MGLLFDSTVFIFLVLAAAIDCYAIFGLPSPRKFSEIKLGRLNQERPVVRSVRIPSSSLSSEGTQGTLTQEIKFTPPPPVENRDPEEPLSFWEQVADIPDGQWARDGEKGFRAYLYEGQSGGKYLAVITQPFDVEWVRKELAAAATAPS
jgi:hypothetical protein